MKNILSLIVEYLLKGGFLTAFNTYLLPTVRQYITTRLYQLVLQIVVLGAMLFLIDWVLPKIAPGFFKSTVEQEKPVAVAPNEDLLDIMI